MRVLYATPGHAAHDDRFLDAIRSLGHDPVKAVIATVAEMRDAVSSIRPDVTQAGPLGTVARWAGEIGTRPLVAVSWGFDLLGDPSDAERRHLRRTLARADALIVDNRAAAAEAESLGIPVDRTVVLPWGVDLRRFGLADPEARRRTRLAYGGDDGTVVVTTRSHEPPYGVDIVIDGFIDVAGRDPDVRLLVVGDGSLTSSLKDRADRSGLGERVHFLGRRPPEEIASILAAADVYVSASRVDGTSVSLLEAMAARLPAVVSDIPGNREWIESGLDGQRFVDGDPHALAEALELVVRAPEAERRRLGRVGRRMVEDRADWSRNLERLDGAYRIAVAHAATGIAPEDDP